jgi:NAD-dependent SIR2 family protein deacetylase
MAGKLRIFISSTMDDLANEREMVVRKLEEFNFEPVNAEAILPNGASSWGRISEELESCHLFVLILGDRYGWIPASGPLADQKVSVTKGEYLRARELNIPILPFVKRLTDASPRGTDDANLRDAFRKEAGDWENGQYRAEFDRALDLSVKVGAAVTRLLSDQFQRSLVQQRVKEAAPVVQPPPIREALQLPKELVREVRAQNLVLFAGSGISLAAGLPSSPAFAAVLTGVLGASYVAPIIGSGFASIAGDFELKLGRDALVKYVGGLLEMPGATAPTQAHITSIELFPKVITTNYDQLFERAVKLKQSGHQLILGSAFSGALPEKFLLKLHGSYTDAKSLVMTDVDLFEFEESHKPVLTAVAELLQSRRVLVVGTSLRDPSVYRLFMDAFARSKDKDLGYCLIGRADPIAEKRYASMGFRTIQGDIASFFGELEKTTS